MSDADRDALIEATVGAFRERDASGRILPSPAWRDLSAEDREAAFDQQLESRRMEKAFDPRGLSTTAKAVLGRARRMIQMMP